MPIYFIQAGSQLGPIKIGRTDCPADRMRRLQSANHEKLFLIRIVNVSDVCLENKIEQWFHRRFRSLRIHGEWFKFHGLMLTISPPDMPRRISHDDPCLAKLLERAGSLGQLAKCGEVDHSTASGWLRVGKIPVDRARKIHEALKIPLHEIRPDIWRPAEAAE